MSEPRTKAGKALLADLDSLAWFETPNYDVEAAILAIEAEASEMPTIERDAALSGMQQLERVVDASQPVLREALDVERLERALLLHAGEFIQQPESFDTRRLVAENIAAIYARLAHTSSPEDRDIDHPIHEGPCVLAEFCPWRPSSPEDKR